MKIRLVECELNVEIGIHDFEQNKKQRVLVDVELESNIEYGNEDIKTTIDYDLIRNYILAQGEFKFSLQETLCEKILKFLITSFDIESSRVYIRKVDVYPETKEVGVELSWVKKIGY